MMVAEPNCSQRNCVHFQGLIKDNGEYTPVCKAFPDGIPAVIAYGNNMHTKPFSGDGGIRFQQRKDDVRLERFVDTDLDSIIVSDSNGNPIL